MLTIGSDLCIPFSKIINDDISYFEFSTQSWVGILAEIYDKKCVDQISCYITTPTIKYLSVV